MCRVIIVPFVNTSISCQLVIVLFLFVQYNPYIHFFFNSVPMFVRYFFSFDSLFWLKWINLTPFKLIPDLISFIIIIITFSKIDNLINYF